MTLILTVERFRWWTTPKPGIEKEWVKTCGVQEKAFILDTGLKITEAGDDYVVISNRSFKLTDSSLNVTIEAKPLKEAATFIKLPINEKIRLEAREKDAKKHYYIIQLTTTPD